MVMARKIPNLAEASYRFAVAVPVFHVGKLFLLAAGRSHGMKVAGRTIFRAAILRDGPRWRPSQDEGFFAERS
jgi:hypothetical protein